MCQSQLCSLRGTVCERYISSRMFTVVTRQFPSIPVERIMSRGCRSKAFARVEIKMTNYVSIFHDAQTGGVMCRWYLALIASQRSWLLHKADFCYPKASTTSGLFLRSRSLTGKISYLTRHCSGSLACTSCTAASCEAGTYLVGCGGSSAGSCSSCPAGSYSSAAGNHVDIL
jgi:hypothetical protein